MYNFSGIDNIFDAIVYTSDAMRSCGFLDQDIDEYLESVAQEDSNMSILEVSAERLELCNDMRRWDNHSCSWRDVYNQANDDIEDDVDEVDDDVYRHFMERNGLLYNDGYGNSYEGYHTCDGCYFDSIDDEAGYWQ